MARRGGSGQRPLLVGAGIIGANLPDVDLVYSWITPPPIGYLLHHRGHTHTVVGLVGLALALGLAYRVLPSVRHMRPAAQLRFWLLIAIALASHLALDTLNSYGVHPFYPLDNRWYFGDAVFILEAWFWLILGVAVVWNGRTRTARLASALPMLGLLSTAAFTGVISLGAVIALAILGGTFAYMALRVSPAARAAVALVVCTAVVIAFTITSNFAREAAIRALRPELRGDVVDVIRTPNPSSLLCWAVILIERREADGEYVLWRGTLSLQPRWKAPTDCASHTFAGPRDVRIIGDAHFALREETHQSLQRLRELAETDCWVRAWLRFGRAPVIERGLIFDLRFAEGIGQNFTQMRLASRGGCPSNVPGWGMPRADLLTRSSD